MSSAPIVASTGASARRAASGGRSTANAATSSEKLVMRLPSIAQPTSASLALSMPTKKNPKPSADTIAEARAARHPLAAVPPDLLARGERHAAQRQHEPRILERRRPVSARDADDHRHDRRRGRDRRDDTHVADREAAVERRPARDPATPDSTAHSAKSPPGAGSHRTSMNAADQHKPRPLGGEQHVQNRQLPALEAAEEIGDAPGDAGDESECESAHRRTSITPLP